VCVNAGTWRKLYVVLLLAVLVVVMICVRACGCTRAVCACVWLCVCACGCALVRAHAHSHLRVGGGVRVKVATTQVGRRAVLGHGGVGGPQSRVRAPLTATEIVAPATALVMDIPLVGPRPGPRAMVVQRRSSVEARGVVSPENNTGEAG
jgi:hypothetical protein